VPVYRMEHLLVEIMNKKTKKNSKRIVPVYRIKHLLVEVFEFHEQSRGQKGIGALNPRQEPWNYIGNYYLHRRLLFT
jgi:hypothetical protein